MELLDEPVNVDDWVLLLEALGLNVPEGVNVLMLEKVTLFDTIGDCVILDVIVIQPVDVNDFIGVAVTVLESTPFGDTEFEAVIVPEVVWVFELVNVCVDVIVITDVRVLLIEPVCETDTVEVLLCELDFVFVNDTKDVLVDDTLLVVVLVTLGDAVTVGVSVLVFVPGELLVILGEPDVVFDDDIEDVTVLLINAVVVCFGDRVVEGEAELVLEDCIDLLDVLLADVVLELGGDLLDVGQEVEVLDTEEEEVVVLDNPVVFVPVVVPVLVLES